jgi:predicted naringenin-chalcone synthase
MQRYERHAVELALKASQQAFTNSACDMDAITHLVTVSCSGFQAPGVDVALIQELGLPATTQRTHIGFMGCHGALNGLRVAAAFVKSDPTSRILLCAVELCSLHFQYGWNPEKILANALFADGAAAMVGVPTAADSSLGQLRLLASSSCLIPNSADAMSWRIGDHGFVMTLSREVPGLIEKYLCKWIDSWLANFGLRRNEIGSWIVHPGGPKILDAVEAALQLPDQALEESRQVLAEHGNMSSPTVLFILDRMLRRQTCRPFVAMGFGPGLTVEAALFI